MSNLPSPYYFPGRSEARQSPAYPRAPQTAGTSNSHYRANHDYTLVHHGRQVRIGPVAFWIVVGTLVAMAIWSVATGSYFAFKEDVLTRLIGRQAEMQFAYEDRIAELRGQVDRIASRQLLDQEQVEQKLESLLRRQAVLEQRSGKLGSNLNLGGDDTPTGSIPRGKAGASDNNAKPSPISDTVIFSAPADREARLQSRNGEERKPKLAMKASAGGIEGALARAAMSMDRVDNRQMSALSSMEEKLDQRARNMRGVLADLGVDPAKASMGDAVGGPFIPAKPPRAGADAFDRQLYRVAIARAQADRYSRIFVNVPVKKPVFGEIDTSSPFGMRMDPFVKGPAIHSGLDIRGDMGEPVRATAAGKVETAGWNGGYGNMVEIDHGNQFSTRYGHLSAIGVKVGQMVKVGDVIGRIGSTGRSTGPHLHYETRINDEAVDPQKFLRAGVRLGAN
jgi:murein DD-endopeptidase MepM/ murein hydrolase activator NlpD